jgi:hypothetical protein
MNTVGYVLIMTHEQRALYFVGFCVPAMVTILILAYIIVIISVLALPANPRNLEIVQNGEFRPGRE